MNKEGKKRNGREPGAGGGERRKGGTVVKINKQTNK
jgi:hypothetical protein